jgi:hypothetical protein
MILAIDPGIKGCGIAEFDRTGTLLRGEYVPNPLLVGAMSERVGYMARAVLRTTFAEAVSRVVTECPQVYKHKSVGADLIPLAQIGAMVVGAIPLVSWTQYLPHEWKGSVNADTMTKRILQRLTAAELLMVQSFKHGGLDHNTIDAVGIGLHYFGRLKPRRVIAR